MNIKQRKLSRKLLPRNTIKFSRKLLKLRKFLGLTGTEMARVISMHLDKDNYYNWESGKRVPPKYVQEFVLNKLTSKFKCWL